LPPLLEIFRDRPKAGAVGGKHIHSDGRLREAGGVISPDGSIAGFGNCDKHLDAPPYSFVREVDYCSATFLATRRSLFEELNGFSAEFPCWDYSAADYGFKIGGSGFRVFYQPQSAAAHMQQRPVDTDSAPAQAHHPGRSREMFVSRWADTLRQHTL
jgi:GT2 family glycosyltransferase